MQHHIPSKPWLKLGADLFNLNGREYLLMIDYYSNYPEVALLEETSSKAVINKLKSIFSHHGIPSKLITDNGQQFISSEFKSFTDYYCNTGVGGVFLPISKAIAILSSEQLQGCSLLSLLFLSREPYLHLQVSATTLSNERPDNTEPNPANKH